MIKCCRNCGAENLNQVLDLGLHPLADTFIKSGDSDFIESYIPLTLVLCDSCESVQTGHSVLPEQRYQHYDYSYDSMNSPVSISHFEELAHSVMQYVSRNEDSLRILEFGSNVGTLLLSFRRLGVVHVQGVDPSKNISMIAEQEYNVPTFVDFFNSKLLETDLKNYDIIVGCNVVNHTENVNDVFYTASHMLNDDGVFVFEVPYLYDLVTQNAFDTIYHEHVHYHSVKSLKAIAENNGFKIDKIEKRKYMCGTIRLYCKKSTVHCDEVQALIHTEMNAGLFDQAAYSKMLKFMMNMKFKTMNELSSLRISGERICGIGAATKGNTLLNYFGIDSTYLECISDNSKLKQGKLTPGSRVPIVSDEYVINEKYKYALILPWNISDYLKKKLSSTGIRFLQTHVD